MIDATVVGYRGPDVETVIERWEESDRPFALRPWESVGSSGSDAERQIDCVVLEAAVEDVRAWVAAVHERVGPVPIIVLTVEPIRSLDAVVPAGVSSHFSVRPDADRVEVLSALAPHVEAHVSDRRRQSLLESLFANVPMSTYVKDRTGRHVAVSGSMLDMIGPPHIENPEGKRHHHPDDVLGKTDFDLYSADLATESVADDRSVAETGEPVENRVEESQGERGVGTNVVTTKSPWYDQTGAIVGIIGITQDISERKQYEHQLKRQNQRLRRLATMVGHDIRNPLTVAVGRLEIARETGDPPHFDAVERSLARIDALVTDIITVMRQGEPPTDLDPVTLADVARDVWDGGAFEGATLDVSTGTRIYADPGRLRQLLEQLFTNAIEHGRPRDRELTVTVGELPDDCGFFVADDGVGIPADEREQPFQPGLSGSNSSTLGLTLVSTIADAHNWKIRVTESATGGARFEFHGVRHYDA